MNKGVLVGGGVGLLMLILLGGYWFSASAPEPLQPAVQGAASGTTAPAGAPDGSATAAPGTNTATTPLSAPSTSSPDTQTDATAPAAGPSGSAPWNAAPVESHATPDTKPMTRDERRAIRSQIRTKMSELLANGQNATPAETQAFLNDVEKLGKDMFDPRYFSTMREMVAHSARTQELSRELGQIANSKDSKDVARQREILAEMRDIGDRISNGAAALQSYARDTAAVKKP